MTWFDSSDNEDEWIVRRRDVPSDPNVLDFPEVARFLTTNQGGFGGVSFTDEGLQAVRCYNYVVEANNTAGNSGWNVNGPVQMCTGVVPGAPTALTAAAVSGARVDLTWTAATGTILGYRLERSTTSATGPWDVQINIADPAAISYSDIAVLPTTTYWYRLFAYNASGDSLPSDLATVTTPGAPPPVPGNLAATASAPSPNPPTVTLTWTYDAANTEDGFVIQRMLSGGAFADIATLDPNVTTYLDTTVAPKQTYIYRIRAFQGALSSDWSNEATAVTPGQIPEAPASLRVTSTAKNYINLAWQDRSNNETGFRLEYSTDGVNWTFVTNLPANTTVYRHTGLQSKRTYYYRILAFNADGNSAWSNTATGRTK